MPPERQYSTWTAFIYMFNLTLGTGALAIPSILSSAGWILGSVFLLIIAFLSYVAVSFVVESMASANAILRVHGEDVEERGERAPLIRRPHDDIFKITSRVELGEMAIMFFPGVGQILFYVALVTYLYGSAIVYATFVPASMVQFALGEDPAHSHWEYDLCLVFFAAVVIPFSMKDFQSTKQLQIVTMIVRMTALSTIVVIATAIAIRDPWRAREVPLVNLSGVPNLFGGAVYSFMCQHSLPGVIAPMREKTKELTIASFAFCIISAIYLSLFASNAAAFGSSVESPITFNFSSPRFGWIGHVLVLFPVFTVSSSFPMMSITLRNNLAILLALLKKNWRMRRSAREHKRRVVARTGGRGEAQAPAGPATEVDRPTAGESASATSHPHPSVWLTLLACVPPIVMASAAHRVGIHVDSLLGFTGGYSGCAVMFVIPACLAIASRKKAALELPEGNPMEPQMSHPKNTSAFHFTSGKWPLLLIAWSVVVVIFVTVSLCLS